MQVFSSATDNAIQKEKYANRIQDDFSNNVQNLFLPLLSLTHSPLREEHCDSAPPPPMWQMGR